MEIIFRIIGIALRHPWRMFGAYACTAGALVAYVMLPRYFGDAIDEISVAFDTGEYDKGAIFTIVLIIFALSAIRGLLSFFQTYLGEALSQFVSYDIRNSFYDHVQHMSFGFHDRHHTGNLMSRVITDVENIRMFINMGLIRTPYFVALFIAVAFLLLRMDWQLGLISISFMPIVALYSARTRLQMRRIWLVVQEKMAEMSTVMLENFSGVRVIKAFASEPYEEVKFDAKNLDVTSRYIEAEKLRASSTSFMLFTFLVAMGLILFFGGRRVIAGDMSPGDLGQFIFYLQILQMPVRMTGWLVNSYARATSAGERLFEILDYESPVKEVAGAREIPRTNGRVHFDNISFGYNGDKTVLTDIELEAEPGQVIALLGAPGSGKTSMVNLIPRFYDVTAGSITLDGIDIRDATLESLRRNIGIVQQDVFLFTTSVRENIAYGRVDASDEEIKSAAKVAQLDQFIESLPDGYETQVGERGSTLSGGQRQRMSIARAVLLDPPVLILDDSTSSVDAQTEDQIRTAMTSVMENRTTFVIAHRLNTVHRADVILVLKDGEVVERGTHQQLLALDGQYREIYELQLRPQEEVMREIEAPVLNDPASSSDS
ncbi:MAG: ABC transporter ATP-binding protein [SAR202 cluster bacterium]|nr:ABC transporter ATP-binding protein [SAR202 cluster bacterium]MDP7225881.1 ABC transporter ATP-binding protein [SAR202 cluster bacterium]